MGKSGPKPSCLCGRCRKCRDRERARRRYHGITYPSIASGRFRASRLHLPRAEATLGYVAGLVDGEGCLTEQNGSWRLQLAMTDKEVIDWLGRIGGTVRERTVKGNRKPAWMWLICAQAEVEHLLVAIKPYLRVKRKIAIEVLAHIRARAKARAKLGI